MKIIAILFLALLSPSVSAWEAGQITNLTELAALPAYCKGTQLTRAISHDPKPYAEYIATYGPEYIHLHHYCWALNDENHNNYYYQMLSNIQYVIDRSSLKFILLPDIYITKARILFKAKRDTEAVATLLKLTQIKPEHAITYAQLGDYFQKVGDKSSAIRYYEQGLLKTNKKNADFFIFRIKKLDETYKIPPIAPDTEAEQSAQDSTPSHPLELSNDNPSSTTPNQNHASDPMPASAERSSPVDQVAKPNPYCRFCP